MKGTKLLCITALMAGCTAAPDLEQQIDELYGKMSQEERIAQLRSMYISPLSADLDLFRHRRPHHQGVFPDEDGPAGV